MRRPLCTLALIGFLGLSVAGCSADPEELKRQYIEQGDQYFNDRKYAEAVVQYRNAVAQDGNVGPARAKLASAYEAMGDYRNARREAVRAADLMPDDIDVQLQAARVLAASGQFEDARTRVAAVLEKDPKNATALIIMGNALAGLKDLDGAIEQVQQAIDADPAFTLGYTNLAGMYLAKGNREQAKAAFERAVQMAPESLLARLALANFQWATGEPEEAERELRKAIEISPRSVTANRALATLYIGLNRAGEAEQYLKVAADESGTVESRLVLADYYVRNGKVNESTRLLDRVKEEKDGLVPATLRLALLDFGSGRRDVAYQKLEGILQQQPKNERVLAMKAQLLVQEQKFAEALSTTGVLLEANPSSVPGRYLRAVALESTSVDQATAALQQLLQAIPNSVPVQTQLARLYVRQNNPKAALELLQPLVKAQPRSGLLHFMYGQALLQAGDLQSAERELLGVARGTPDSVEVHLWLGMLYRAKREPAQARAAYEKALALKPGLTAPLAGLIGVDLQENNAAAARARLEARIGANPPTDPALLQLAADTYFAIGDASRAEAFYRRLLEADADNVDAYSKLGAIYLAEKRLDEARKTYEEIARQQDKPVVAETMIGTILTKQNKRDEARRHFERAVAFDPRAAVAANNLAWDYVERGGNLDVALNLAQAAKAQLTDNPQVTDTLGWIYYKKGLTSLAITTLQEGVRQAKANPVLHYHLGLAHLQNGDKGAARRFLEQALSLNANFPAADDAKRVLASLQG